MFNTNFFLKSLNLRVEFEIISELFDLEAVALVEVGVSINVKWINFFRGVVYFAGVRGTQILNLKIQLSILFRLASLPHLYEVLSVNYKDNTHTFGGHLFFKIVVFNVLDGDLRYFFHVAAHWLPSLYELVELDLIDVLENINGLLEISEHPLIEVIRVGDLLLVKIELVNFFYHELVAYGDILLDSEGIS